MKVETYDWEDVAKGTSGVGLQIFNYLGECIFETPDIEGLCAEEIVAMIGDVTNAVIKEAE